MTRDELREQINLMEALTDVLGAIDDVSSADFEGAPEIINLALTEGTDRKAPIAYAHGIPREVLLAGLHAMKERMEQMRAKVPA